MLYALGFPNQSRLDRTPNSFRSSDLSTFSERLQELIGGKRQNAAFARRVGLEEGSIRQYLKGSLPRMDALVQIAKATGVHINWLATGEGPRDSSGDLRQISVRTQPEQMVVPAVIHTDTSDIADDAMVLIPLLDVEPSAGTGTIVDTEAVIGRVAFDAAWLRARSITPQAAHVLTARGDSMEPTIRSGDTLIVDTAVTHVVDNGIYAVNYSDVLLVKRLKRKFDGSVIISSDNQLAGFDETVPAHELDGLRIAGRVMWYGRMI